MRYRPSGPPEDIPKPEWRRTQDFYRVAEALQAKGAVRHVDGWCWRS